MNELDLIARLTAGLPMNDTVVAGPGDDCAVLDLGLPGQFALFKTDAIVQGVHFTLDTAPERIGHKALGRCLSDVAAMAGCPSSAVITLGLPPDFDADFLKAIYSGMSGLARRYDVAIVGGETVRNPERIFISVALIGTVQKERCLFRKGARDGDAIFVTGELGGSIHGRHLEFEPRLAEAQWLARNFSIHSMIDLSDGLAGDLRHLLRAAQTGAELLARAIPVSRAAKLPAKSACAGKTPLRAALTDGEDFELLFTIPARDAVPLMDAWKEQFPELRLSCIGRITEAPGIAIRDEHGVRSFTDHGYVHFDQP